MIKSIDSLFYMGSKHTVCDDYSIIHKNNGYTFAGIADGCSSSKNSSLGSRFLLLEIVKSFDFVCSEKLSINTVKFKMIHCVNVLKNQYEDILGNCFLDTTLIFSISTEDETIVFMIGDGTIISRDKNGEELITTIDFENNMPFYLSYYADDSRLEKYLSIVNNYTTNINGVDFKSKIYDGFFKVLTFKHKDVDMLVLSTDGISSFVEKENKKEVETFKIAKKFLDVKSSNGEFMQRKVKTLKREFEHEDDLSVVGFIFE